MKNTENTVSLIFNFDAEDVNSKYFNVPKMEVEISKKIIANIGSGVWNVFVEKDSILETLFNESKNITFKISGWNNGLFHFVHMTRLNEKEICLVFKA